MTKHSTVVGGSSCARLIACPGSKALCDKMPKQPSSTFADAGTLLHRAISLVLNEVKTPTELIGMKYEKEVLTAQLVDEKLNVAVSLLNEIDPNLEMELATDVRVDFGDFLPNVFGEADLIGRIGTKAVITDFKFGDGVIVDAEENKQLLFYTAAAMRTAGLNWLFDDATEIELVIVQPPQIRRWVTTVERVKAFEVELKLAVQESAKDNAKLSVGSHCKFCTAKPVCPLMTGAVDRALVTKLDNIDAPTISAYLKNADLLEGWISSLRELAFNLIEQGKPLPGYKLVAKRATRKWIDEEVAKAALLVNLTDVTETTLISPAVAEKALKKLGLSLPEGTVVAVSSGNTLANEDDPRPAVLQIGQQLTAALSKIV